MGRAATTPTFNFSGPIPGIKIANPFVKSNANGQMVIVAVNDNELGKVMLTIRDPAGTEVQTAEFFLTGYEATIGVIVAGSSIVMIDPSAEYPNGAPLWSCFQQLIDGPIRMSNKRKTNKR